MKKIVILATHGKFASGIKSSIDMIVGQCENLLVLDCYNEKEFDLEKQIECILSNYVDYKKIFVVDIKGSSIYNKISEYINEDIVLISGLNLPLVIEILQNDENDLESIIENVKNQIEIYKPIYLEDEEF